MARIRVPLNNFERGEVSPSMTSRTDLNVYVQSAEKCRNFFLMAEGGVKRRPGTEFIHKFTTITVDNAKRLQVKIEPFLFSDDERYIVAFSAGRCDFFRIVASTGAISHIQALTADTDSTALPWTVDTIEHQTIAQSADNMFVAHSSHIQMRIVRTGLTTFEVRKFAFDETTANDERFQPYFAFQESGVTLTPSGTTGNITLTTSANYFESGHVGTIVRYKGNECLVTGFTSATQVNATVRKTLVGTTADTDFDEQSYSTLRGFPSAVTFHEDRLWFAGTTSQPDGIWSSKTSEFFNFDVGTAQSNESIQFAISAGEFNSIKHLTSSRDLQVFTSTSEFFIPSFASSALTPTNAQIRRQTPFGSASVRPTPFDGATVYVQRGGKTVREFVFSDEESAYVSTPISLLSSHLVIDPTQMTAMRGALARPESYAFFVNSDGTIAVFHSIRNEQKAGWTLWTTSDTGTTGGFHSMCTIDERLFCVAKRDLGGGTVRFMLEEFLDTATLDCSDDFSGSNGVFTTNSIFENNAKVDVVSGNDYLGNYTQGSNQIDVSAVSTTSSAEIGFGFTGVLTTLPLDANVDGGPLTAEPRQITRVNLDLVETLSVSVSSGGTAVPLILQSTTDDFSQGLSKFTGKKEFRMLGYSTDPRVLITQTAPVSLQLNGMIVEVAF